MVRNSDRFIIETAFYFYVGRSALCPERLRHTTLGRELCGAIFSNAFKINRTFVDMRQADAFQTFPGSAGSYHLLVLLV